MSINKKTIIKSVILITISVIVVSLGYNQLQNRHQLNGQTVLVTGIREDQAGIIKELTRSGAEYNYIRLGNEYFDNGEYNKAIEQYNMVLERNKKTASLINARRGLINAYEKKRDYKRAHDLLFDIVSRYTSPPTDKFRIPDDERLKYLDYASRGEYELAIEHAERACKADAQLANRNNQPRQDYVDRLNDLKKSKSYIESLKKR